MTKELEKRVEKEFIVETRKYVYYWLEAQTYQGIERVKKNVEYRPRLVKVIRGYQL